jgi:uncharacterized protein DUF4177
MVSRLDVTLVTIALHSIVRGGRLHARIDALPENRMNKIEYKTILLPYKTGIFQSDSVEVGEILNKEGIEGWQLSQIVLPSTVWGRANTMVAILERAKA